MNWSIRIESKVDGNIGKCVCTTDVHADRLCVRWRRVSRKQLDFYFKEVPSNVGAFWVRSCKTWKRGEKNMTIWKFDLFNFVGRLRRLAMPPCVCVVLQSFRHVIMNVLLFFSVHFRGDGERTHFTSVPVCLRGTCCLHFSVSFFSLDFHSRDHGSTGRVTIYKQITNEWNVYK